MQNDDIGEKGQTAHNDQSAFPVTAQQFYASSVQLQHLSNDFTLLFSKTRPMLGENGLVPFAFMEVSSVVFMSPQTAKDLSLLLSDGIANYEAQYGVIETDFTKQRIQK